MTTMTRTRTDTRDELTFFDTETGGLKAKHPTIQVAMIAVDMTTHGWPETERIEVKVQFDESLCDAKALELNHYDPKVWAAESLSADAVRAKLNAFFGRHKTLQLVSNRSGRPYNMAEVAGHNVHQFDCPRLKRLWGDDFAPFAHWQSLDTLHLARWAQRINAMAKPENNKLGTLLDFFDIKNEKAHDALSDVAATVELAKCLVELMGGYHDGLLTT